MLLTHWANVAASLALGRSTYQSVKNQPLTIDEGAAQRSGMAKRIARVLIKPWHGICPAIVDFLAIASGGRLAPGRKLKPLGLDRVHMHSYIDRHERNILHGCLQ